MQETQVRFYQTGTFTVGNRLLNPGDRTVQSSSERFNSLNSGHRACQGCGEALGARYAIDAAMAATGGQVIAANATGCLEVFSTPYPESAWRLPWFHSLFGNTAAVASGMAAAVQVKAAKSGGSAPRIIAMGGDGGTTDIGFGCLSGMFDRNDDVLYICFDNQAYMNTGVQRSSQTPPAARTATTMPTPGHPVRGSRYIHILVPCPLGWGVASNKTVEMARLAQQTGFFPVFEAEYGEVTHVSKIRRKEPIEKFLMPQKRYAHLFNKKAPQPEIIERLQAIADRNIVKFGLLEGTEPDPVPPSEQGVERALRI